MKRYGSFVVVVPLTLTVACTSVEELPAASDSGDDTAHSGVSVVPGQTDTDADVDVASDATPDSVTTLPPPSVDPYDDPAPPGTCGAALEARPPALPAPTCASATRGWKKLASADIGFRALGSRVGVFDGSEVLVLGTRTVEGSKTAPAARAYDPSADTWRTLAAPTEMHWTTLFADGLWYAVGGEFVSDETERTLLVEVFDKTSGTWSALPTAPIVNRSRPSVVWSTTTHELIVWGGTRASIKGYDVLGLDLADGAAWSPTNKRWRKLADAPLKGRFATSVWDGRHLVVAHGGRTAPGEGTAASWPISRSAIYDPLTDAWTMVCDPLASRRIGAIGGTIGQAGELGVIWGGYPGYGGDGDDGIGYQDGSIFDSVTRTWQLLPAPPVAGDWTSTYTWSANGKLWAWGLPIKPGVTGGVVFDPGTRSWKVIDDLWGPPSAWAAITVWTGCDLIVSTDSGTSWASLRP